MTLQEWTPLYSRLCAALGRKETPAQLRAYFDAMHSFPAFVVTEAVVTASSRTWPPTHPHAGELREIAVGIRRAKVAPASMCDVCHGSTWTQHHCEGVTHAVDGLPIRPISLARFCGHGDIVHQAHEFAVRCYQCWQPMERAS